MSGDALGALGPGEREAAERTNERFGAELERLFGRLRGDKAASVWDLRGFQFPTTTLDDHRFPRHVLLDEASFGAGSSFVDACFEAGVSFDRATLGDGCSFRAATPGDDSVHVRTVLEQLHCLPRVASDFGIGAHPLAPRPIADSSCIL